MPPFDLSKLREDAQKVAAPPRTPAPGEVQEDPSANQRRHLQDARGALNAEAAPPGQEPDIDPIDEALAAGRAAGPRGSERAMGAYFEKVVDAAHKGDPRVSTVGAMGAEDRERWMADARARQMANRDQSGAAHR
jgi:hypothetical protein